MRLINADDLLTAFPIDDEPMISKSSVRMTIQRMPTIEPEWISVSERLPDTADHVLVTLKWSDTNYEVCELDYLVTKYEAEHTGSLWATNMIGHVIAWTPLPPAYKGE